MKILITGGTGNVGKAVVERFVAHGCEVRVISVDDSPDVHDKAEYTRCDITSYGDVREQVRGCDAIVHLAAISNPMVVPAPDLFNINVAGTYNVFEAAADEGIRRVAQASSINAFGCFWGVTDMDIQYLPIDEEHPTFTTDVYSFSKGMVEEIADYYWRREGITSASFRLPAVWGRQHIAALTEDAEQQSWRNDKIAAIDEFAALPEADKRTQLAEIAQSTVAYRQRKLFEYPNAGEAFKPQNHPEEFAGNPIWGQYVYDRFNFWAYIDERDSAQAFEKAITTDYEGSHALFVNASNNWFNYDSKTLANLFFSDVSVWKQDLTGSDSLVSIAKAQTLIGFQPEFEIEG
ncbi:MAG: NAD(P)-dependent oxidoreductase [Chloroflexota bacterium]